MRKLECQVVLLDNSLFVATLDKKSTLGQELYESVCQKIGLSSAGKNYFGLQFVDDLDGELTWLDLDKEIRPQRRKPYSFQFAAKFYPHDTSVASRDVQDLLVLQIKDSLIRGKFVTSVNEHAILDGFFTQALLGDFKPKFHTRGYLEDLLGSFFAPPNGINSDMEVSEDVYEALVYNLHRSHKGMSANEAKEAYLEISQGLPFYGMSLHRGATDKNGNGVLLAVCSSGVLVFATDRDGLPGDMVANFPWNDIVTLIHQNRKFYVVVYSHDKKDGGSYSYRFHGHFGHRAADRIVKDALDHQKFFYQPEKQLFRRSKSFGEVDSMAHLSTRPFNRKDNKYATTSGKIRSRGSFKKFTDSIKRKIPQKQRSAQLSDSSTESPNVSTMTYI